MRETAPRCRTDNFREAMIGKLALLRRLQERYDCPVFVAGDIFDSWKCSHWLTRLACSMLPKKLYVVPGQHEMPGHRLDNLERSPLGVLEAAGVLRILSPQVQTIGELKVVGAAFGHEDEVCEQQGDILILHKMVWHKEPPFPGAPASGEAGTVLNKFRGFNLIVTGDNHKSFVVRKGGRVLVNCGSMMRLKVDQIEYQPVLWLWTKKRNELKQVPIHIDQHAVTESEQAAQQTEHQFEKFLCEVRGVRNVPASFVENMKQFLSTHPQPSTIRDLIWEAIEA